MRCKLVFINKIYLENSIGSGGKYTTQENCNVEIAFPISKNRILTPLCNSSPVELQVVVPLIVTAVIYFNSLVTHSSPRYGILYSQSMIYKQISLVTLFPIKMGDE
jgi:hypothetical protein